MIILTIVIAGAVGFLFWQNFVVKDEVKNTPQTYKECLAAEGSKLLETYPEQCVTADGKSFTNPGQAPISDDSDLTKVVTNELDGRVMTLHYPDGWVVSTKEDGDIYNVNDAYYKDTKLTSPSGKFYIKFSIMKNGGLGGTCDPEALTVTKLETKTLPNVPNARYAEVITHYKDDVADWYSYRSEIQRLALEVSKTVVGSTGCNLMYAGLFSKNSVSMDDSRLATVSIFSTDLEDGTQLTSEQITQALVGPEYNTAKRILLTLTDK